MSEIAGFNVENISAYNKLEEDIKKKFSNALADCKNGGKDSWKIYYRGQSKDYDGKISASLFRKTNALCNEAKWMKEWLKSRGIQEESLKSIGYIQHYGQGTRLLDFTTDINVALYFACCDEQHKKESGYVYCYSTDYIEDENDVRCKILSDYCFFDGNNEKTFMNFFTEEGIKYNKTPEDIVDILRKDYFLDYDILKDDNERMKRQKGLFLWMGDSDLSVHSYEKGMTRSLSKENGRGSQYPGYILRVVIEPAMKQAICEKLEAKGYSQKYLFPEVEKKRINFCLMNEI